MKAKDPLARNMHVGQKCYTFFPRGKCVTGHTHTYAHTYTLHGPWVNKPSLEQKHTAPEPHTPITLASRAGPGDCPREALPRLLLHWCSKITYSLSGFISPPTPTVFPCHQLCGLRAPALPNQPKVGKAWLGNDKAGSAENREKPESGAGDPGCRWHRGWGNGPNDPGGPGWRGRG